MFIVFFSAPLFSQKVVVAVRAPRTGDFLCLLSIGQFSRYVTLLRRLSDLLCLQQQQKEREERRDGDASPAETGRSATSLAPRERCSICYGNFEESVLSCGHALCHGCEKRWTHERLRCPFCRRKFRSAREIRETGAWDLTACAWSSKVREGVDRDVAMLRSRLDELLRSAWLTTATTAATERTARSASLTTSAASSDAVASLLESSYVRLPRSVRVIEDCSSAERRDDDPSDPNSLDDFVQIELLRAGA